MKPGFWDYMRAAFNARPIGMFVPPNWIGLGVFGLLGALNPGFWIIGVGCELAYLGWLGTHPRFQRVVNGGQLLNEQRRWETKVYELVRQLPPDDQQRYRALESRCKSILEQQSQVGVSSGLAEQGQGLGRLIWIYLRLLFTREAIRKIIRDSSGSADEAAYMKERIDKLREQLQQTSI